MHQKIYTKAHAALPDNTDAGISAVRVGVQRLNEAEDVGAVAVAIEQQMAGVAS